MQNIFHEEVHYNKMGIKLIGDKKNSFLNSRYSILFSETIYMYLAPFILSYKSF